VTLQQHLAARGQHFRKQLLQESVVALAAVASSPPDKVQDSILAMHQAQPLPGTKIIHNHLEDVAHQLVVLHVVFAGGL
jgi:hypothetical protein